jgi:flagellar secretion chaperone FliS
MNDANLSYRTSSSRSNSGVGLVILLYEQLVQDLRRAATAMDDGNIESRTFELGHALEVVGQLQGRLDMQAGGEVAQNLDRFYGTLQEGILAAQVSVSASILQRLIHDVLSVREAWLDVERGTAAAEPVEKSVAIPQPPPENRAATSAARKWKA